MSDYSLSADPGLDPILTGSLAGRLLAEDQDQAKLTCIFTNAGEARIFQNSIPQPLAVLTGIEAADLMQRVLSIPTLRPLPEERMGVWGEAEEEEYQQVMRDALDEHGVR